MTLLKTTLLFTLCISVLQVSYADPSDGSYLKPLDSIQQKTKWIIAYKGIFTTIRGQVSSTDGKATTYQPAGPFPLDQKCDVIKNGIFAPDNVRIETGIVANGAISQIDNGGQCGMNRINLYYSFNGTFHVNPQTKQMSLGFNLIYSFAQNNAVQTYEYHHTWAAKWYNAAPLAQPQCNLPENIPVLVTIYCKSKATITS